MGDSSVIALSSLNAPRLRVVAEESSRIEERFGLEPLDRLPPAGFTDREGFLNLPFQAAEQVAKMMAEREPHSVLLYLQGHEEGLLAMGYQPGQRTAHDILRSYQPSFALARQWSGLRSEAELLTREIDRLRQLVNTGIRMLKESGADTEARRLERALFGR